MQTDSHADQGRNETCDVIIIGGGPAGATAAPYLAQKGLKVVVLEREHHPRFHIGESLLPANLPLFEDMGIAEQVKAIGMYKPGAEFHSPMHGRSEVFHFADAWDKSMPFAYQVKRAEFDAILVRNAREKGAEVIEGCKATSVAFEAQDKVVVTGQCDDGQTRQWTGRFLIDASGRDTFLANRFRIKQKNPKHNSSAIYGHFKGARRSEGEAEGNISIFWFDHGWFWFIPLINGETSIGMVTWPYFMKTRGKRSLEAFFMEAVASCAPLAERLANAELLNGVEATGNFSYTSERNHGENYVMIGDAFAFIDPVFSSGVMLAMKGGMLAADAVETSLRDPARRDQAMAEFDRQMRHGPKEFSWFIYRVTNPIMRDFLMHPRNYFRVKEALLSVLAGDIFGKTPIWNSVRFFKLLYYIANITQPVRAYKAWQKRRFNIRQVEAPAVGNA